MAILSTTDDYDEVRAALGPDVTASDLPDSMIARDVYQGAAEREILLYDPLALTRTDPVEVAHIRSAAIFLTASRLALRLTRVVSERIASWSANYLSQDPEIISGQLRQQGMAEIAAVVGVESVVEDIMGTQFTLAPAGGVMCAHAVGSRGMVISSGVIDTGRIRGRIARLLRHRYTRVPHIDILDSPNTPPNNGLDEYGDPINVFGTAVSNIPCLFDDGPASILRLDTGTLEVVRPSLYVLHDDPLAANDKVVNILDTEGIVLVAEAVVDSDSSQMTGPGAVAYRQLTLREITLP